MATGNHPLSMQTSVPPVPVPDAQGLAGTAGVGRPPVLLSMTPRPRRIFDGIMLGVAVIAILYGVFCLRLGAALDLLAAQAGPFSRSLNAARTGPSVGHRVAAAMKGPSDRASATRGSGAGATDARPRVFRSAIGPRDGGVPALALIADQAALRLRLLGVCRQLGLGEEKIQELEKCLLTGVPTLALIDAYANSDEWSDELTDIEERFAGKARPALGEDGVRILLEHLRTAQIREIVATIAIDGFYRDSPFGISEGGRVVAELVAATNTGAGEGRLSRRVQLSDIDFARALDRLRGSLPPEAIRSLEAFQAKAQFDAQYSKISGRPPYRRLPGL